MFENASRREFVKGAGAMGAAGITATAGFAARTPVTAGADEASAVSGVSAASEAPMADADRICELRPAQGEGYPRRCGAVGPDARPIMPLDATEVTFAEEVDVVVVGTGLGGLSAALHLANSGLSVIALEKEAIAGGAGRHASNLHCNHGGSKLQRAAGYSWIVEDFDPDNAEQVKDIAAEYLAHYQYSVDPDLMMRQVSDGPKWIDWLDEQDNIELEVRNTPGRENIIRDVAVRETGQNAVLANNALVDHLVEDIEAAGGQVRLKTACTNLIAESGAVVGVQAGDVCVRARRAVVLAAGGFGMNLDMLEEYIPTGYMFATSGGPLPSHTGEVTRMGIGAGADIAGWNSFDCWDGALDEYWGDGDGNYWHYMWKTTGIFGMAPFPAFDTRGNRVPYYIGSGMRSPQPRFEGQPFGGGGEAICTQYMASPDHRKYVLWDGDFNMETWENWAGTGYEYMNPKDYIWGALSEAAAAYVPENWDDELNAAIERGAIKRADSIEELEGLCGFEAGVLVEAVRRWNECCEAGQDDCIVPMDPSLMLPLKTPPFYCGCYGAQIGKTNCGLRVTDKMEVVDTSARTIPGLYACWSTAGGFVGENMFLNFGNTSPMGCDALSGMSGWVAARAILGEYDEE